MIILVLQPQHVFYNYCFDQMKNGEELCILVFQFFFVFHAKSVLARLFRRLLYNVVNSYRKFSVSLQQKGYLKLRKPFNLRN